MGRVRRVRRVRAGGRGGRVRRPPRRRRGSLRRQAGQWRPGPHHRLELACAARRRELLERRRVTLREVQLRLHHGGGRRQRPRRLVGVRAPRLRRVRVHVVIDVLLHLGLGGEPPPAVRHRAAEWPVALVRPRVLIKNRLLSEVFSALRTLVGLLAGVDAQVLVQNGPLPEEARAVYAAVRLLVRVDAEMLRQMRLLSEPLAALRARVWPRLYVDAAMLEQSRFLLELLLADRTADVQRHGAPTEHVG